MNTSIFDIIDVIKDSADRSFDYYIKHALASYPGEWEIYDKILCDVEVNPSNHLYARDLWCKETPEKIFNSILELEGLEEYEPQASEMRLALELIKRRLHKRVEQIREAERMILEYHAKVGYRLRERTKAEKLRDQLLGVLPKEELAEVVADVASEDDVEWWKVKRLAMGKGGEKETLSRIDLNMNCILDRMVKKFTGEVSSEERDELLLVAENAVAVVLGIEPINNLFN